MTGAVDAATAAAEARAAADGAGVAIVGVSSPEELDVLRSTMEAVWGPEVVPPRNLLRGLALGGSCLLIAGEAGGLPPASAAVRGARARPVGFALGWLGWEGGVHFHSHQVGVRTGLRGGGVGYALKLAQRALCLEHGVTEMRWTFDPMLMSNARFNLGRLGASAVRFIEHCYGDRRDAFNTGERTDRLEVSWRLDVRMASGYHHGTAGDPASERLIEVPDDYASMRLADPAAAAAARAQVGAALSAAFAAGSALRLHERGYAAVRP